MAATDNVDVSVGDILRVIRIPVDYTSFNITIKDTVTIIDIYIDDWEDIAMDILMPTGKIEKNVLVNYPEFWDHWESILDD